MTELTQLLSNLVLGDNEIRSKYDIFFLAMPIAHTNPN